MYLLLLICLIFFYIQINVLNNYTLFWYNFLLKKILLSFNFQKMKYNFLFTYLCFTLLMLKNLVPIYNNNYIV